MTAHHHDVASYATWTTEALEQFRDRVRAYILTDRGWKVGPAVLAQVHSELRARGVDV